MNVNVPIPIPILDIPHPPPHPLLPPFPAHGQSPSAPHSNPDNPKDNADRGQDPETVSRHRPAALRLDVEEGVGVKPLGGVGEVGQREVEEEEEDQDGKVEGWGCGGAGEEEFEEGGDGV